LLAERLPGLRRVLRTLLLSTFLGLALGYTVFYSVFPLVSFPADSEPNLVLVVLVLFCAAVLAGFETQEVPLAILQAFLAVPIGAAVASGIALSPVMTGFVEARADEIVGFTLVLGFPILLLSMPMNIASPLVGMWIRGQVLRRAYASAEGLFRQRK